MKQAAAAPTRSAVAPPQAAVAPLREAAAQPNLGFRVPVIYSYCNIYILLVFDS